MKGLWALPLLLSAALWARATAASPEETPPPELLKNLEILREWDTARDDGLWKDFEVVAATGAVPLDGEVDK
jgi:hypothetical protein